jgi:putative tricarboxylic transport membrane protein
VNAHTKRDITGGLALCALALAYLWGATLIPQSTLSDEVGARGLPFALGFLLALVGAAIAVKAWLARTGTHREESAEGGASLRRVLGLLACVALYVLVAWLVGYIIASAVLLLAVSLYEDAPLNLRTFGVAGAGAIVFWLIFVKFLNVEQPIGKLLAGS